MRRLAMLALLLPLAAAQVPEGPEWSVLVEDPADFPVNRFSDLREVAVRENGTSLVFQIIVEGPYARETPFTAIHVFYELRGTLQDHRVYADGGSGGEMPFDECVVEEEVLTCAISFEAAGVAPGDVLDKPSAISYFPIRAQDYAPGGLWAQHAARNDWPSGTPYVVRGPPPPAAPSTAPPPTPPQDEQSVDLPWAIAPLGLSSAAFALARRR